jgi:anti-anti-sigma factor
MSLAQSPSPAAARRYAGRPQFMCTWEAGGSRAAWVHVAGDLDVAGAPQLRQTLGEARLDARLVVLDLREVTSIDSSGVDVILDAAAQARRRWGRLMLVRGSFAVERMLALAKVTDQVLMFDLHPDEPSPELLAPRDISRRRKAWTVYRPRGRRPGQRRGASFYLRRAGTGVAAFFPGAATPPICPSGSAPELPAEQPTAVR